MRSNTKKNEIYEIRIQKRPVNNKNKVLLLPKIIRPNIQNIQNIQNMVSSVSTVVEEEVIEPLVDVAFDSVIETIVEEIVEPVIETIVEPVIKCVENDTNNLQYVKSKIISKYGNLYKTKTV